MLRNFMMVYESDDFILPADYKVIIFKDKCDIKDNHTAEYCLFVNISDFKLYRYKSIGLLYWRDKIICQMSMYEFLMYSYENA